MAQRLIKVPPTKNTLLKLKKQVKFLEEGHDLLERKRELLTRLVYERIGDYRRLREEAERSLGLGLSLPEHHPSAHGQPGHPPGGAGRGASAARWRSCHVAPWAWNTRR